MKPHSYYWSEDFRREMLELSDNHIMWDINRHNVNEREISEFEFFDTCNTMIAAFEEHYHCRVYRLGRSGRHVCVEDTPTNRRLYWAMKTAVEKMQWLVVYMLTADERVWNDWLQVMPRWIGEFYRKNVQKRA